MFQLHDDLNRNDFLDMVAEAPAADPAARAALLKLHARVSKMDRLRWQDELRVLRRRQARAA